jgi:hypothetical protein
MKDTSSKKQGKSISTDSMSNKNVTHTQNQPPKTKSNSVSNRATDDYKYIPQAGGAKSSVAEDKRPSSGNMRGV